MINNQSAIYARVSCEQQAAAHTIASQIAALRERVLQDGLPLPPEMEFVDDGYSGATLIRPALERLRDGAAAGGAAGGAAGLLPKGTISSAKDVPRQGLSRRPNYPPV